MNAQDDRLLEQLAGLGQHDVDSWRAGKTRERAHAVLARNRRMSGLSRTYTRWLEPAMVGCFTLLVLAWAFSRAFILLR
jgi:hypothetical protein